MDTSGNLNALVERVLDRSRQEATAIAERGAKAAERETERAGQEQNVRTQSAETALSTLAEQRLHSARAEAEQNRRRALMNAQEAAINTVFDEALEKLQQIDTPAQRLSLLQKLIREGIQSVGSPAVRVRLNSAERELALNPDFPENIEGVTLTLDENEIDTAGGPIVTDQSGRIVYENTFEARLERMREPLRRIVAQTLGLEDKQEGTH